MFDKTKREREGGREREREGRSDQGHKASLEKITLPNGFGCMTVLKGICYHSSDPILLYALHNDTAVWFTLKLLSFLVTLSHSKITPWQLNAHLLGHPSFGTGKTASEPWLSETLGHSATVFLPIHFPPLPPFVTTYLLLQKSLSLYHCFMTAAAPDDEINIDGKVWEFSMLISHFWYSNRVSGSLA